MSVDIRTLTVGTMATNCYLLTDAATLMTAVVDPGDDADYILNIISDHNLKPAMILATHGHFDHVLAAAQIQLTLNIPLLIHRKDTFLLERTEKSAEFFLGRTGFQDSWITPKPNGFLDKETISLGESKLAILETPGHTPGSVCYYLESEQSLLTGDVVFADGTVGRTDFSYSQPLDLAQSLQLILSLPEDTKIFPGHGPAATLYSLNLA